ncbi:MAG TPA: LuxR C-terminal-related transcriptional regulator [Ktedonobacterales bacterium]
MARAEQERLLDIVEASRQAAPDDAFSDLLRTKLTAPPPRDHLVTRSRLIQRLENALPRKLTLVSAPPGSGKTTLLSAWLAQVGQPIAWVTLDEDDDDPIRFWTYAVAALERAYPGATGSMLALLRAPQPPTMRALQTLLLNALDATNDPIYLIFDDYHVITARPIHDALDYLLARLPPHVHLVLASRTDPPLALAQLRARDELTELRAADLRFTGEEATSFLAGVMNLRLAPAQIALLEERTEGWIAGLQLAALSLRGRDDPGAFLEHFAGDHRYIADYLAGEVIDRQPERLRAFLLRTSILDQLCGPLCDAIMEEGERGEALLAELERANLFIIPLDDERRWYRYHALFAAALRQRLRQIAPEEIPALHQRASAWFEREGMTEPAVRHALAAGETERAAALVERVADAYWKRGDIAALRALLDALPDAVTLARPRLCLFHAWVRLIAGRFVEGLRRLEEAEESLRSHPDADASPALQGALYAIKAAVARTNGDHEESNALARRTLDLTPEDETIWRSIATLSLAENAFATGDLAGARRAAAETMRLGERGDDSFGAIIATLGAASVEERLGHLSAAAALIRRTLERYRASDAPLPSAGCYLLIGLAALLYEWNQLDEAERLTDECLALGHSGDLFDGLYNGYFMRARIRQARGDHAGALRAITEEERITADGLLPSLSAATAARKAHILFAQGKRAAAARWVNTMLAAPVAQKRQEAIDESEGKRANYLVSSDTLPYLLVGLGRAEEALAILDPLIHESEAVGYVDRLIPALAIQALALHALGRKEDATATLGRALALAEPEGYIRTFADMGELMATLLTILAAAPGDPPVAREYLNTLLDACAAGGAPHANTFVPATETLSEREREVLRLLAAGASNQDIADALVVSIHTVKTHVAHILAKLHAANRTEAVARAREQGLL